MTPLLQIALGGAIVGLAIPISSTLASSMTLPGLLLWGAIASEAHLGGFLTGWAFAWMWQVIGPGAARP